MRTRGDHGGAAFCLVLVVVAIAAVAVPPSAGAYVYWANYKPGNGTAFGRANLDGSGADQSFISAATDSVGVAVDGHHVYWTNAFAGTIGRANLDGTGVNQLFITGIGLPLGVAVDGQHVYWTDQSSSDSIGRANLDGSASNDSFITGAHNPGAVVADGQHIYWTNPSAGTIGRANLDGTSVDQSFITLPGAAAGPAGVAVDGRHIYWTTQRPGFVARANLDGSGVEGSFIATGDAVPAGLAVDAEHVYWANEAVGTVGRANLDGSSPDPTFITGRFNVAAVAVDSLPYPTTTTVACAPATVTLPAPSSCTATVTAAAGLDPPTGTVAFTPAALGAFGSLSCSLVPTGGAQSACALTFTPSLAGAQTITAAYSGDVMHAASSGTTPFTALAPPSSAAPPPAKPSNAFALSRPKLNRRTGSAVLIATVPGAGRLVVTGRGIRPLTSVGVTGPGTVRFTIKGNSATRRRIGRTGRAMVTVKVTYTPTGGDPNTVSRKLTLRLPQSGRREA